MNQKIPEGWTESHIGEFFNLLIGGTPRRSNELYWDPTKTSGNKWVSIRDLGGKYISKTEEMISDLGVEMSNVKLLPAGTVIMSFKLTIGRLGITQCPLYTNEAIVGFLEKKEGTVDTNFLYYGLQFWDLLVEADQAVKGATLNKDKILRITGLFPPLREQKNISTILASIDEAIENTQRQIDKLRDLRKAVMNKLLTKGIGHTEFKESELGLIPKSWRIEYLSDIAIISRGKFSHRPRNDPTFYGGKFPFLQTGDVPTEETRIDNYSQSLSEKGLGVSKMFPKGTLVMTIAATIGEVAILTFDSCFPDSLVGISVKGELIDKYFLLYFLRMNKEDIMRKAPESAQKNLNLKILKSFPIKVPPVHEQINISTTLSKLDNCIVEKKKKLEKLQLLKKALTQDLLTGKVRVKVT